MRRPEGDYLSNDGFVVEILEILQHVLRVFMIDLIESELRVVDNAPVVVVVLVIIVVIVVTVVRSTQSTLHFLFHSLNYLITHQQQQQFQVC